NLTDLINDTVVEVCDHNPYMLRFSPFYRPEMVLGWYHSHPGFNCWISDVDINTQQSVKGKVVIDVFRLINPQTMMLGQEPRQTTSKVGHLNNSSIQLEKKMLLNLHKKKWIDGLILKRFDTHSKNQRANCP
ncbi:hypothetical protein ACJX0J_005307, partial [Zea mays]